MEWGLGLLLPLFLGLLRRGRGEGGELRERRSLGRGGGSGALEVEPPELVVAVEVGGSQQLTCRVACADPGAASVQWRGLDTSLGAVQSGAGSSVLSVRNASLAAAGIRVCVGSCGNSTFQRTVELLVFSFPDQLTVFPVALVAGRDQEVTCTAHNVSPARRDDQNTVSFSLLLGDRELEGAQAQDPELEEESQDGEDSLFQVTQRWLLPGLERSHRQPIPVLHSLTSREPPVMTSPEATPQQGSTRSPGSPDPTSPRPTSPGPTSGNSSARTCRPEIHQSPAPGGLELLCEAACSPGVAVRWIQAPGGLEAYDRREAGAQAWLSMPWAECTPEGWFQCRLDPGGQMASLYLVPQICSPVPSVTVWTGSVVLALLLLAVLTYRLWKCCRQTTGPTSSSGPPALPGPD
uniref:Mucosal vascular addressin cell adhesion molecule 1 n=1 Tax=Equus asinus TaxID=9793 RepID=A0A8C4N024_EQUAS